ncbi:hypothetical protein [Rodentibacter haemolyticus]|uniref:Uncharacterized protein n=1 Tax=Rodentibacter haemolyticus TaxID=2778911 RepID=A0ABX6UVV6_9PAST|nr:hypothetical protein [Rodentibacter haemolyticus]QPB42215.1 hypothetical protein IHV77_09930 [Rodentibacter haemolyticus]
MTYQYYLVNMGDQKQQLVRGNPDNWLSFATYNQAENDWDNTHSASWADRLLVSGFDDFSIVSEKEAITFIKTH